MADTLPGGRRNDVLQCGHCSTLVAAVDAGCAVRGGGGGATVLGAPAGAGWGAAGGGVMLPADEPAADASTLIGFLQSRHSAVLPRVESSRSMNLRHSACGH